MLGLNIFSLFVLLCIIVGANKLKSIEDTKKRKIVKILLFMVLSYNVLHIVLTSKIPVEFSTVSYFIVPLIVILNLDFLKVWTIYASLMAGTLYYLTMVLVGGTIYHYYPYMSVYTSLFCHGSLLLYGLIELRTVSLQEKERYKLIVGLILMAAWAMYIRPQVTLSSRIFIYEIIDAKIVKSVFQYSSWLILSLYYSILVYLLAQSTRIVIKLNQMVAPMTDECAHLKHNMYHSIPHSPK